MLQSGRAICPIRFITDFLTEVKAVRYRPYQKALVILVPFAALAVLALSARFILTHFTFPTCPSVQYFQIYCPGCGSTRAVQALLRGDFLLALRQNLSIPVLLVLALLYYLEFALKIWGVRWRIPLLHNVKFMVSLLILWFVYFVLRNLIPAIAPI